MCLWWWERRTDEAAPQSVRSVYPLGEWQWRVGGPSPAHSWKSTCCALSGRNRPEIRDPYRKTKRPGGPRRASVCSTSCRKQSNRWVFALVSFLTHGVEAWLLHFSRKLRSYKLRFVHIKRDKRVVFRYSICLSDVYWFVKAFEKGLIAPDCCCYCYIS